MGATPKYGFPYPDGGELANNSAFSDLAGGVESTLDAMELPDDPAYVTLNLINSWEAITNGQEPVRLYRMGRFVVMMGEILQRHSSNNGYPVPENRYVFATLPAGWRPAVRFRVPAPHTATDHATMYVSTDGAMELREAKYWVTTPGYSVTASWITA